MRHSTRRVHVIYRAATLSGRTLEMRLIMDEAQATVADAWRRLSAASPAVDAASLEIETRPLPARLQAEPGASRPAVASSILVALAEQAKA